MIPFLPVYIDQVLVAHTLIRFSVAFFFLYLGLRTMTIRYEIVRDHFASEKYPLAPFIPWIIGLSAFMIGVFYTLGFLTFTISILSLIIIRIINKVKQNEKNVFPYTDKFFLLLIIMIISLIFSGPGYWALDVALF